MKKMKLTFQVVLLLVGLLNSNLTTKAQISFAPLDTIIYSGSGFVFPVNSVTYLDLDNDDNLDVLALTPFTIVIKRGKGDGTFSENEIWYQQTEQIYSISNLCDINSDGYYDLALMQDQYLSVLLGSVDGFTLYEKISFDTYFGDIRWLDYNNDNKPDLIAESTHDILINENWDTDLNNFRSIHNESTNPYMFELLDLNADGYLDLVLSTTEDLIIYFSNNGETFTEIHRTAIGYLRIECGDINMDGYKDFVYQNSNELYTLTYNDTNQSYVEENITNSEDNINLRNPKLIDLDNNNSLDLVFENKVGGISYKKNIAGVLGSSEDIDFPGRTSQIYNIFGLDLNGDNQKDLMFHGMRNQEVHLLNNDLTVKKSNYGIFLPDFTDMAYNDIDNDGNLDIIATSKYGKVLIFYGNSSNTYSDMVEIDASFSAHLCIVSDINSDNHKDIIYTVETSNNGINNICIIYGKGNREFKNSKKAKYFPNPKNPTITDFDNDDIKELLIFERGGSTIAWFEGIDTLDYYEYFNMSDKIEINDGFGLQNVITGHLDSDGFVDIAAINRSSSKISILLNNGSGNFNVSEIDLSNEVYAIQTIDFDNNSIGDLVAITENNSSFYLTFLTGNNNGTFIKSDSIEVTSFYDPRYIDVMDIDADNDMDILISQWDYTITKIVENNNSSYSLNTNVEIENIGQGSRLFHDLNKDGTPDILTSTWYDGKLMYQLNNNIVTEPQLSSFNLEISEVTNNSLTLKIIEDTSVKRLILIREDTSKILEEKPVDNNFYSVNNQYGIGSLIDGAYTVYKGLDTLIEITNLENNQTYSLFVFEYITNEPNNTYINYTNGYNTIDTITLNSVPHFTSTEITYAVEDSSYSYNIEAHDDDPSDILTISAPDLPSWLSLTDNGDGTALLHGTPANNDIGEHVIEIELTDSIIEEPVIQSFKIEVSENEINSIDHLTDVFHIFPNPVKDIIHIKYDNEYKINGETILRIFDLNGKIIIEKKGQVNSINISNISSGEYLLEITYDENRIVHRFIKY